MKSKYELSGMIGGEREMKWKQVKMYFLVSKWNFIIFFGLQMGIN